MLQYKYTLDKSSRKFVCPKCDKRTYVRYVEIETGNYLDNEIGRCDRETNCGHHFIPDKGKTLSVVTNMEIKIVVPSFHNIELINKSLCSYTRNNFILFLKTLFSSDEVDEIIEKYKIGTSKYWKGATVFWQIDNLNFIHAGKVLQYNSETGKRVKDASGKSLINWSHSILKKNKKIDGFNLCQCLFGLHLIDENFKIIGLVESEKTAIIMSLFKPNYLWLATGSKQGFKYDMLLPIKNNKIIAFPDKGEYEDWFIKAQKLNALGFKITINNWIEKSSLEIGCDLADVVINNYN